MNKIDINNNLRRFLESYKRIKLTYAKTSSLDLIEDLICGMIKDSELNYMLEKYSLIKEINVFKPTTLGNYTEEFLNQIFYEN